MMLGEEACSLVSCGDLALKEKNKILHMAINISQAVNPSNFNFFFHSFCCGNNLKRFVLLIDPV